MRLYKFKNQAFLETAGKWYSMEIENWNSLINHIGLLKYLKSELPNFVRLDSAPDLNWEAPIGTQEIWAAGVTYLRSKTARMDEASQSGGSDFYNRVYKADRPELFYKSSPHNVAGPNTEVFIRKDSVWNVPEPELTLFVSSAGTIEGYTIGNDMSSRSIEGENPLYLPQAKTYDRSAALGPCILILPQSISFDTNIGMEIKRDDKVLFQETISLKQMKRSLEELVKWLYLEITFPQGCFLMTGTGLVPPDEFTLLPGDEVLIRIEGIGVLQNFVRLRKNG